MKYKYDEKGNITEVYENSILVAKYKYDSLSRLIREDNKALNKTTSWEYDAGGNITNRFEYEFTTANDLNEKTPTIIPYSYATSGIRDRLMEYKSEQFEYDTIGNPILYRNNALVWEKGRQLKSFGNIANYTYNASGIRTGKIITIPLKQVEGPAVNGTMTLDYFLDGNKIISQQDVANKMFFIYGVDGIIGFTIQYNNIEETYYYKKNIQGDIIGLYNSTMELIAKYEYDAWGNHIVKYLDNTGSFVATESQFCYNDISNINRFIANKNPFRYRSYYYDFETGLYYLNSRYYDPEIGRFINIDDMSIINESKDLLNGLNLFIYCNDNPVMLTDMSGEAWWHWLIGALLVVFAAVAVVVTAGGAMAGVAAVTSVLAGGSAATLGATIAAGAFIGAVTTYAAMGLISSIGGAITWNNTGSFTAAFNEFASYGATAMWSTLGAGIAGGILSGLSYAINRGNTGNNAFYSKQEVKRAVKETINNTNKMHHIMQPKHLLPNSPHAVGRIMQKTLIRGDITSYKTVLAANWKNYQVIFTLVNNKLRISDMWKIFIQG